jgi:uncharacterized integral membrane protein (TIGR00697 family)
MIEGAPMSGSSQNQSAQPRDKDLKLFSVLTGIFASILVISTIASSKIFTVAGLNLPGGVIVFPVLFIFNDILTEVYGYARSRRVIWTGLACQALAGLTLLIVGLLPPAPFWPHQEAYLAVLGFVPRIAVAGLLAYFCGEIANSFVLSKMKYWEKGERGWKQSWRFLASTLAGEAVDSIVFMGVAFFGTIPPMDLLTTIVTLYLVKVIYEVLALPLSTRFANWIKRIEGIDHIDHPGTNYNPFAILGGNGEASQETSTTSKV